MESRNWKRKHDWCVHTLENILITAMNEFKRHNIYVRKANKNSSLFPPEVWRRHSQSRLLCCYLINSTRRPLLFFALFFLITKAYHNDLTKDSVRDTNWQKISRQRGQSLYWFFVCLFSTDIFSHKKQIPASTYTTVIKKEKQWSLSILHL